MSVKGMSELLSNLKKFNNNAEKDLSDIVNKTAFNIHATAVEMIQNDTKSGVVYTRNQANMSATHQASAKDEAPASDTGALVSSLHVKQAGQMTAYVYTNLIYAPYLEFGTTRMDARPFLYPSLWSNNKQFYKDLNGLLESASKGLSKKVRPSAKSLIKVNYKP